MVSPIFDIVLFLSSYVSLFILRKSVERLETHPPILRVFGFAAGCVLLLSISDWVFNFAFITYQAVTDNVYLFYTLFAMLLVMVVALRAVLHPLDSFEVVEVKDFLRESLLFHNYHRRKDADFQEEYNRHIVRKIHRETSDIPIQEILPEKKKREENRFGNITAEVIEQDKAKRLAEQVRKVTEGLRRGEVLDATDPFRIELMSKAGHPYLTLLNEFTIDPAKKIFTIRLPLPDILQVDANDEEQLDDIIGNACVMLQLLVAQSWLQPFIPFFSTVILTVFHTVWGDLGTVSVRELLTISIFVADLRRYQGSRMNAGSFRKIASISIHRST